MNCPNCDEAPSVAGELCSTCRSAELEHGHHHVGHEERVEGCPLCTAAAHPFEPTRNEGRPEDPCARCGANEDAHR